MKYIRTFESHRTVKANLKSINPSIFGDLIKESVISVGDLYKVRSMVDIPQSLINSYVKKVKDTTGKNLRQFFGDVEIAEELVKHITTTGLDIDKIDGSALMGGAQGQGQTTAQTTTEQPVAQTEVPQSTTQETPQAVAQETPQAVAQETPQAVAQETPQAVAQETPQAVAQETPQAVAQPSAQFEEPAQAQEGQTQEEEEKEEEEEEEDEDLPL